MAFDMSSLFAPTQPMSQSNHPNLWTIHHQLNMNLNGMLNASQFPSAAAAAAAASVVQQQQQQIQQVQVSQQQVQQQQQQVNGEAPKAETIQGIGQLTWLSAKAGLITCKDKMVISFQLKDFCDQMLNDLTSVLRVGFTLSFHAALNETSEYTATIVQPIYGPEAEMIFLNKPEVDLEASNPTPPNSKDAYSPQLEAQAIPALLAIFQRHGLQQIQLSSLHSQMSNCGDEELFRYVGTSSLKRRQFVERRTHIFRLQNDDSIILQLPAVYMAVYKLSTFLLRHGGATSIQSLFDYYMGQDVAPEIREHNGDGRQDFLNLLTAHNWVFALFPNRTYVSVRRNLPRYDYPVFIKTHFPELEMSSRRNNAAAMLNSYGQPNQQQQQQQQQARGIQRTMSVQMCGPFGSAPTNGVGSGSGRSKQQQQQQNLLLQQQQQRPITLWDSTSAAVTAPPPTAAAAATGPAGSGDSWMPSLFSPSAWSNTPAAAQQQRGAISGPAVPANASAINETLLNGTPMLSLLAMAQQQQQQQQMKNRNGMNPLDLLGALATPMFPIGRDGCTCSCTCGRSGAPPPPPPPSTAIGAPGSAGVIGHRGSSSRASGGSASPPSLDSNSPYERFSPFNGIGSIGDRLNAGASTTNTGSDVSSSGPATSSSTQSATAGGAVSSQRYYDPFGTADLLNGTQLSSLNIGN